jgi:hypothetical protein
VLELDERRDRPGETLEEKLGSVDWLSALRGRHSRLGRRFPRIARRLYTYAARSRRVRIPGTRDLRTYGIHLSEAPNLRL